MSTEGESFLGVSKGVEQAVSTSSTRYAALRIVVGIYRILAFLVGIAAIIVIAIGIRSIDRGDEGILFIIGGILGGLVGVVTALAAAEGIRVFLDIEENTRNTYYCISNQQNKQ